MPQVAVVTGCSSGLGRSLCYELHTAKDASGARQYRVFATGRNLQSLAQLKQDGIEVVELDVTSVESISRAVQSILVAAGTIDLLICNAGQGGFGPLAEKPLEEVRAVLETNVVGALACIQAVAPLMARRRSGTIVAIGSVSANLVTPFAGAYCASKAALHAMTDALRMELAPFDVSVMLVELGAVRSAFGDNSAAGLEQYAGGNSMYKAVGPDIAARAHMSQTGDHVKSAEEAAAQILSHLDMGHKPPARVSAGGGATRFLFLGFLQQWAAPWLLTDYLLPKKFGLEKLRKLLLRQNGVEEEVCSDHDMAVDAEKQPLMQ